MFLIALPFVVIALIASFFLKEIPPRTGAPETVSSEAVAHAGVAGD